MNSQTLYRTSQYILVIGAILATIVMTLSGLGHANDFVALILIKFIGAGFVVIGLACAPFLLISKEHFICALKDLALPIGLMMSCFDLIVYFGILNEIMGFYFGWLLPAVAGGMVSLTLADTETPQTTIPLSKLKSFLIWLWILCICNVALISLKGDPIWVLSHPFKWILCLLVVYLFCIYNPKQNSIYQRFSVGAIASIILAISLSTIGSGFATESDDPNAAGRSIALGLIGIVYGLWVHMSSIVIGKLSYGFKSDTKRSNWHLAEIFTFFVFLVLPPNSLPMFLQKKQVDPSEQTLHKTESDTANTDASSKDNVVTTDT